MQDESKYLDLGAVTVKCDISQLLGAKPPEEAKEGETKEAKEICQKD